MCLTLLKQIWVPPRKPFAPSVVPGWLRACRILSMAGMACVTLTGTQKLLNFFNLYFVSHTTINCTTSIAQAPLSAITIRACYASNTRHCDKLAQHDGETLWQNNNSHLAYLQDLVLLWQCFLTRGARPPGGVNKFPGANLCALYNKEHLVINFTYKYDCF